MYLCQVKLIMYIKVTYLYDVNEKGNRGFVNLTTSKKKKIIISGTV